MDRLIVLYEPRWAIGKKDAAPLDYIQNSSTRVRRLLGEIFDAHVAHHTRVVYGGSISLSNFVDILNLPGVDDAAISRATWDPIDFARMVKLAEPVARAKCELNVL